MICAEKPKCRNWPHYPLADMSSFGKWLPISDLLPILKILFSDFGGHKKDRKRRFFEKKEDFEPFSAIFDNIMSILSTFQVVLSTIFPLFSIIYIFWFIKLLFYICIWALLAALHITDVQRPANIHTKVTQTYILYTNTYIHIIR